MNRRTFCRGLLAGSLALALPRLGRAAAPASPGVDAVDTHAHVFTRALTLAGERRYAPDYDAGIADYLAMLDRNGMARGVLIQPSFLGTDNGYMVSALRQAPERLRGIAVLAPEAGAETMRELAGAGVVGLRLNLIGRPDPDFGAPAWQTHLARVKDLGWQIEVQAEARRLAHLLPPLIAAGIPVVVDHFGRIDPELGLADPGFAQLLGFGAGGGVWVKLSGAYRIGSGDAGRRTARAAAEGLRASFGPERLIWGSDWPHTQFETRASPAEALRDFETWVPDAAERRIILGDTPAKLFHFDR
ncbi:Predicted metal-dependent hydrolase, TIM-barrel fold [Methylobacterium sp. 174MFSha1.1]|uniref:amidohydrolase family protein n=1 Tax=Methylobacterium sp. 174MFSha1.1 TaxID=1502749 RepID=UPI0008EF22AA|nr:amidohydrolase family protein [Methylobacterium sp. 174MFSha1.1]SFU76170.1 Predicted metal-dependent hydrolase, TIM-barrel fold [Methylobacterium sp. 174MFSha1.1]